MVEVIITDRKVYNQYANGNNLTLNLGEFNTYLRGGVMNVQRVDYTVEINWFEDLLPNTGQEWDVDGNQLTRKIGNWITEGFSIGDTIDLDMWDGATVTNQFTDRVITNITDTIIFFNGAAVPQEDTEILAFLKAGKTDLFALEYSFGIIPNIEVVSDSSFKSLLDNTDQTYYADGIGVDGGGGRSTTPVNMQPKTDAIQSWVTTRQGATDVAFVSRTTYVQTFKIRNEYIINPYIDNSFYDQNKSLKYVSKFDFRDEISNINAAKVQIDELQKGSVGYFDENYNGYNNDFTVSNVVYTDVATASVVTELNISSKTKVELTVTSASNLFNDFDPFVVFHSYIPDFEIYDRSADEYRDVWKFDSVKHGLTAGAANGDIIKNVIGAFINSGEITIEFEIEFTSGQQQDLEEGFDYKIAIEVGDGDITTLTDNVTLLIDEDTYSKDANITDLIISDEFGFAPYNEFITGAIFESYKGWVEDEIASIHRFGVNRTVAKDAEILNARFKIVAYEDATGETFDLQEEQLDLSEQLLAPPNTVNSNPFNIQLIDDDRTRGYRLPLGDEFNLLLFETDNNDATYQYYEWRVGFKMNWQTWISLPNADSVFIIPDEPFRNLNNRASNYSLKNGWSIRVIWEFDMQGLDSDGNAGETDYSFITNAFEILDFDEQDDDPTTWDCEIFTFDELNNNLGGEVLNDEYTNIKAIFTPSNPYIIPSVDDFWGELRIAEKEQPGFDNDVITTTKPFLDDNRLIPLEGETQAKLTLVGNTLELEGRVDFTRIKENIDYKLSARLIGDVTPPIIVQWIFKTESDIPTDAPFDPLVTVAGGEVPTWTLIEGYNQSTTNFTKSDRTSLGATELNGTCQNVVVIFSTNDASNILSVQMNDDNICETLSLAIFDNLTSMEANSNPSMTGFTQPTIASNTIDTIDFNNTGIVGVLDFSNMDLLEGTILLNNIPLMTDVTFASVITGGNITILRVNGCNITGVFDLSMLTKLGGEIRLNGNALMTDVTFADPLDGGATNISSLNLNNCNLTGVLDLTMLDKIGGAIRIQTNPLLTGVTFTSTPDAGSTNISNLLLNDCNLTGTLDLSDLNKLGGTIDVQNNSLLTTITYSSATIAANNIVRINITSCDITGTHDMSKISKLGGAILFGSNSNLTGITFPASIDAGANAITQLTGSGCNLTGTLDLSMFTKLGGIITLNSNPLMTGITMPVSTQVLTDFLAFGNDLGYVDITGFGTSNNVMVDFDNNGMTLGEVDNILSDLNGTGWTGGTLDIAGSNAAPTLGVNNVDKLALEANGWTVNVTP